MTAPIGFNRPAMPPAAYRYLREAVRNMHLSGDGPFTKRCHDLLEGVLGAPKVLLTTSCTHALEMSALLLGVGPGDEVIVPSFTFVSTANAFALRGARVVFADVDARTLNLDPADVARKVTPRTRAVALVHYAGVAADVEAIAAAAPGAVLIEDNAHGLF